MKLLRSVTIQVSATVADGEWFTARVARALAVYAKALLDGTSGHLAGEVMMDGDTRIFAQYTDEELHDGKKE